MRPALQEDLLALFRALAQAPDDQLDLVEGALLIAQSEYPGLDRAAYQGRLEEMGREAREALAGKRAGSLSQRLERLSQLFTGRWGFHGNRDDYYDPRNSFLNDVLDRRTGIPITLSLVYMEVGRRAGIPLAGIGMPGHFLVGCAGRNDLYVDAFSEGALLTRAECAARFRQLHPEVAFRPEFLVPVGPGQILVRMLNNLLEIYLRGKHFPKALGLLEMILCLAPDEPEWLRRRALVHYHLKQYARAVADLERYLEVAPRAPDREELLQQLALLHQLRSMVN